MDHFRAIKPYPNETMKEYNSRFRGYIELLEIPNDMALHVFEKSMSHSTLRTNIVDLIRVYRSTNPGATYADVTKHIWNVCGPEDIKMYVKKDNHPKHEHPKKPYIKTKDVKNSREKKRDWKTFKEGRPGPHEKTGDKPKCWKCGKFGHTQNKCKVPEGPTVAKNKYKPTEPGVSEEKDDKKKKDPNPSKKTRNNNLEHHELEELEIDVETFTANSIQLNSLENKLKIQNTIDSMDGCVDILKNADQTVTMVIPKEQARIQV
ncbi:hypothetical protein AKO1_002258, partial [Acrasis kona]